MQSLCVFTFLYALSLLPCGLSLNCNDREYPWPVPKSKYCCEMCPPGKYMFRRESSVCGIQCDPCVDGRYTETYNVDTSCDHCYNCNQQNMELESKCNSTHNAVCRCKAGYRCTDQSCKDCVPIPTTAATTEPISTLPPSTTTLQPATKPDTITTLQPPFTPVGDKVWLLVIIVLVSAGIGFVVAANIKPFLRWIRSKHGYLLAGKPAPVSTCSEDEEVSTPVQEVCGKCDQPIDV